MREPASSLCPIEDEKKPQFKKQGKDTPHDSNNQLSKLINNTEHDQIQPEMSPEQNELLRVQQLRADMQLAQAIIQEIRATPKASKKRTWEQFKLSHPDFTNIT